MDEKRLIQLKKDGSRYNSPEKLLREVGFLFENLDRVPLINGYKRMDQWNIIYAGPKTISDRLTVENFMEGLKEVYYAAEKSPKAFEKFSSFINLNHFEPGYPNYHVPQITVYMSNGGSKSYALGVFGPNDKTRDVIMNENGYVAETSVHLPSIEEIMDLHMGPF